ncbi:MAG: hypothetical protein CMK88_00900 [Pseudomonadales bacterium]|nr:hypothetical protein [Pseudomonadales bacterium]|tara:strand:+ start:27635 stop:27922 length:288 start_codon:yes stop_codon:yes gene_type:complete
MNATAEKTDSFLLRLRKQDTPTGVSSSTIELLMQKTGLSKTEIAHLALRELANRYLPTYERDDQQLTQAQIASIRAASSATDTPDELFTERLFNL